MKNGIDELLSLNCAFAVMKLLLSSLTYFSNIKLNTAEKLIFLFKLTYLTRLCSLYIDKIIPSKG